MIKKLPPFLRGVLYVTIAGTPLFLMLAWMLLSALIKKLVPITAFQLVIARHIHSMIECWAKMNRVLTNYFMDTRWNIIGAEKVDVQHWYLLLSNHQSWLDILVLQQVLGDKIPGSRYFMKSSLIWLPFIGQICWLMDCVFMKRYSREELKKYPHKRGKDIEATRKACQRFKHLPITIINFVEGTRWTEEKYTKQKNAYQNLLSPRAGGFAFVVASMAEYVKSIMDVTIVYKPKHVTFWKFCCGELEEITVHIRTLPLTDDLVGDYQSDQAFKKHFQQWLNKVWHEKDAVIGEIRTQSEKL